MENIEAQGLTAYQQIVDNCENCGDGLGALIDNLREVDTTGQFLASAARYLAAVDREKFEPWLATLIESAIEVDRERRYIGSLLQAVWGEDFEQRAEDLKLTDNNFRRIYRRIHPESEVM